MGTTNASQIGTFVPPRCEHKAEALSACIEGHRSAAQRRTNECPSKGAKTPPQAQPQAQAPPVSQQ